MGRWPAVDYVEQAMREGMQIEDANIPVSDKVALIHALSETGLRTIVVGSFVSPRYTPQMAEIDEIVAQLQPRAGVTYTALVAPGRYAERARRYSPPLTLEQGGPGLLCHLCDVFTRRNWNRSRDQEIAAWPEEVARARRAGATEAGIGVNACWGSNFTGEFSQEERMELLEAQHRLWDEADVAVTRVFLGDPMSWCRPHVVEDQLREIKRRWPEIHDFTLHLHDARGMALPSAYAALRALDAGDTLHLDGTIGGIGGCPYCGNGRATGLMASEDVLHMLEGMGIDLGVDLDRLIGCVWMLEEVLGRSTTSRLAKAGPRPGPDRLYDPNAPFVETHGQARHFRLGPRAYEGGISPWRAPIPGPRSAVEAS
jgi:hydroxymethylglutaryl-CoA lyase